jgi:hypothetical protein
METNLGNLWKNRQSNIFRSEAFKDELTRIEKKLREAIINSTNILDNEIKIEYGFQVHEYNSEVFEHVNEHFMEKHGIELKKYDFYNNTLLFSLL